MASFVLRPCKVRQERLVHSGDKTLQFDWPAFRDRFAPSRGREALMTLRQAKPGGYVGLIKHVQTGEPTVFYFANQDRSGRISWLVKRDGSIPDRILEVFKVEMVNWDGELQEVAGTNG